MGRVVGLTISSGKFSMLTISLGPSLKKACVASLGTSKDGLHDKTEWEKVVWKGRGREEGGIM